MSCKRNISRSGKFQFAPVLIVQTHKIRNSVEFPCGLCPAEERLMPDPTLDYYLLPASLFSFQLFITSRQKLNKKHVVPLKYFDSFCLIEWHQADKRWYCWCCCCCCYCWFMLILLCFEKHVFSPACDVGPQKPWDALQHQAALRFLFSHDTTRISLSLCLLQNSMETFIHLSYLSACWLYKRLFTCNDSTQIAKAKGNYIRQKS